MKWLTVLVLVFLTLSAPLFIEVKLTRAEVSKTLIVPDQYPTIQAAVNNATAGDTIFVKKGTYNKLLL
jgi:pectin methylesterase-like acyl-CoA thioesterase